MIVYKSVMDNDNGAGGGHVIENSEGTDLTQRDTLQFGEGFKAEDDDTNEKTVISPDVMQSGDMSDVITPLPSIAPKKEGIKYSTTEQVIGEWIDGKPIYQKTLTGSWTINANDFSIVATGGASNIDTLVNCEGTGYDFTGGSTNQRVLNNYMGFVFKNGNDIGIQSTYKMVWTSVTIQYTKTTDTAQ